MQQRNRVNGGGSVTRPFMIENMTREIEEAIDELLDEELFNIYGPDNNSGSEDWKVGPEADHIKAVVSYMAQEVIGLGERTSLGIGDTATDEQIASTFKGLLDGGISISQLTRKKNPYALHAGEFEDEEKWEPPGDVRLLTKKITEILVGTINALRIQVPEDTLDNWAQEISSWFYQELHFKLGEEVERAIDTMLGEQRSGI